MRVGPRSWPGHAGVQPGDLSTIAPMGNGLGAPLIVFPWGAAPGGGAYAFHPHPQDPRLTGPTTESVGGVVFFDAYARASELDGLWSLLQVGDDHDYAAFVEDPTPNRYGAQLRLVSGFALDHLFRVPAGGRDPQPMGMRAALHAFVAAHRAEPPDMAGWLEGDGDWASESLGFGFLVENAYYRVYRIWTRPWLVTK